MKSLTALFVLCCAIVMTCNSQNIQLEIMKPSTLGLSKGHDLAVLVEVKSQLEIATVIAKVGTTQVPLTLTGQGNVFGGTLPLTTLQQGTHTMTVTATDITNYAVSKDWPFIYDTPPVIDWEGSLDESFARSEVRVKAKCIEETGSPCTVSLIANLLNASGSFDLVKHAPGEIDAVIDLSDFEGNTIDLEVVATDQYQAVTTSRRIYVESSPYLKEVASVSNRIVDFDGQHLAYGRIIDGLRKPEIFDLQTSATTTVPAAFDVDPATVMLTPNGAVFRKAKTTSNVGLYEWQGSTIDQLVPPERRVEGIRINGDYMIWSELNYLYRRNLSEGTTILLSTNASNSGNSILGDGTVGYASGYNIYRFKDGVHTKITDDYTPSVRNSIVALENEALVYVKTETCCGVNTRSAIAMHDGTGENLLSDFQLRAGGVRNQISNGYIAYSNPGNLGQNQVWVRQPSGESHQVTFFGTSSNLELMNPSGDVITINGNTKTNWINNSQYLYRRYLSDKQGYSKEICSSQGKAFWVNDKWYIAMGRTLFTVDTVAEESRVNDISRTIGSDTPLLFSKSDFTSAFHGPGQLIKLSIIELPKHGYLTLPNGAKITAPVQLSRSVLDQLKYVPDPGYEGEDRIVWNASNGVAMPDKAAKVIIRIEKEDIVMEEEENAEDAEEIVTAIAETDNQFSAHPNPVQDKLTLAFSHEMAGPIGVTISNVQGQIMLSKIIAENELGHERTHELNTSGFSPGIYLVRVMSSSLQLKVKKIAVR